MAAKRRRSDPEAVGGAGDAVAAAKEAAMAGGAASRGHRYDPAIFEEDREYLSGFGGSFESEAVEGALPKGQNNPQVSS